MIALRIINIVLWASMAAYMAPGAWSAAFGKARYGDPMRLACFATGVVFVGFNLRALLTPDNDLLWHALLTVSAALAIFIWKLGRTYGRGPRV